MPGHPTIAINYLFFFKRYSIHIFEGTGGLNVLSRKEGWSQEPEKSLHGQPIFGFTNQVGHGNHKMVSVTKTDLMLIGNLRLVT